MAANLQKSFRELRVDRGNKESEDQSHKDIASEVSELQSRVMAKMDKL